LDKKRVLSDADLLGSAQYRAIDAVATDSLAQPIFDMSAGSPNVVSMLELDASNHAITNYINWVEAVQRQSSFMKDGWFQAALVTPPMLELVDGTSNPRYKCDSGVGWGFSILLTDNGRSWLKYSPKPDFMLLPHQVVIYSPR